MRKTKEYAIRSSFPLLWKNCIVCDHDFCLEKGWCFKRLVSIKGTLFHVKRFVCRGCAPTREKAISFSERYLEDIKQRHNVTPSPPKGGSGQSPREKEA